MRPIWIIWITWYELYIIINYSTAEVLDDGCCGKTCGDEEKPLPTGVVKIVLNQ